MANTLLINRTALGTPSGGQYPDWNNTNDPNINNLDYGELAWNNGKQQLYIARVSDNTGGKTLTPIVRLQGTSSQVNVAESNGTFTVSLPNTTSVTNMQVTGNLTVSGTTTTVDSTDLLVKDSLIILAKDQTGTPSLDSGFVVERGDSTNVGLIWDESAQEFSFITTAETGGTNGNVSITAQANVRALGFYGTLTGNVTGNTSGSSGSCTGNAATVTNGVYTTNNLSVMAATTSAQLAGVISDETGTGALVFATSPTLVTPALGTPASGNLANCTFPTLNQSTTGQAGSLASTFVIDGGTF